MSSIHKPKANNSTSKNDRLGSKTAPITDLNFVRNKILTLSRILTRKLKGKTILLVTPTLYIIIVFVQKTLDCQDQPINSHLI